MTRIHADNVIFLPFQLDSSMKICETQPGLRRILDYEKEIFDTAQSLASRFTILCISNFRLEMYLNPVVMRHFLQHIGLIFT